MPGLDPGAGRFRIACWNRRTVASARQRLVGVTSQHCEQDESPEQIFMSPVIAGLKGRCPRCGAGRLFAGFLTLAPRCERCGLDFGFADAGDGPAVFVILIAGFVVVGLAFVVELLWRPPYWVHAALWIPAILVVTLGLLRPFKGVLIALQFHHDAAEGRLDRSDD
jgi:uncharacterized protein (DUF983 family)